MCMSIIFVRCQAAFGCQNALTHRAWNQFYRKQIFAGSFSTDTDCCLENRARAGRFMRHVTRLRDRQLLRATAIQAGKSGARRKVIQEIQPTGTSIATSASIFPWSIWGRSRAEAENSLG